MRIKKVYTDNLPKRSKIHTNWEASVGYHVPFIYGDIKGEFEILSYNKKSRELSVNYNNHKHQISVFSFQQGDLGILLGQVNPRCENYKYNVGDNITTTTGIIRILAHEKDKNNTKVYRCQCSNCKKVFVKTKRNMELNTGCSDCIKNKVLLGKDSIAISNPEIVKFLKNKEDAHRYTIGTAKKLKCICQRCGYEKSLKPISIRDFGFQCNMCADGLSYPSKFITALLEQLKLRYKTEYSPDWAEGRRYDHFLYNKKIIIEEHGIQHYERTFESCGGRSLEEEQENDRYKEKIAKENGFNDNTYIVIDCRKSEKEWIKNSILNSKLPSLLNFEEKNIDWDECEKYAHKSQIYEVCEVWNNGMKNTEEIAKLYHLSRHTVTDYLKKGNKIGITDYDPKIETKKTLTKNNAKKMKKVIQYDKNMNFINTYNSVRGAEKETNIASTSISFCCKGKLQTAGGFIWRYSDEMKELIS